MARNPMLAKIHIAKKELGLDDDNYCAILTRITGCASSGDCNEAQLDALIVEFKRLGWKPKTNAAFGNFKLSGKPHVRKVFAVWGELSRKGALREPSRQALQAFVLKQTGVASPEWLSAKQANDVTEALKAMSRRHSTKAAS